MSASPDETLGCVMNLVRAVGILLLGANQAPRPIKLKSHAHYNTMLEMAMIIFSETKTFCWSPKRTCRIFARIMNCKYLANRQQISLIGAQKNKKKNLFLEVIVMSVYYYYLADHMISLLQEKARADTRSRAGSGTAQQNIREKQPTTSTRTHAHARPTNENALFDSAIVDKQPARRTAFQGQFSYCALWRCCRRHLALRVKTQVLRAVEEQDERACSESAKTQQVDQPQAHVRHSKEQREKA
jgi:hypothetical protein